MSFKNYIPEIITVHRFFRWTLPVSQHTVLPFLNFIRLDLSGRSFCVWFCNPASSVAWLVCSSWHSVLCLPQVVFDWQERCSVFVHCSVGGHQELLKPGCSRYSSWKAALIFSNLHVRNGMAELQGRRYLHVGHAHRSCIYMCSVSLFQAGCWAHCRFLQ